MITLTQATIAGYSGKPCSLFSGYDMDTRILSVHAGTEFRRERREGCVFITNQADLDRDVLFTEKDFEAAIGCFFAMASGVASDGNNKRLVFSDKATLARPSIEKGDMKESGQSYRVDETISCLQVAALATCWYAHSQAETIEATVGYTATMNSLWKMSDGNIFTF